MRFTIISSIVFLISFSCDSLSQEKSLTFTGSSPCGQGRKFLPAVATDAPCEFMKWHLQLAFTNDNNPSTFVLNCQYGMTKAGTTDFPNKQTLELRGSWHISKGTKTNSNAIVYELIADSTSEPVRFVKLGNDILHLLDTERQLMVGTPGWSFTLNRVNEKQ